MIVVDASISGISGDKFLASLIDLGGSTSIVRNVEKVLLKFGKISVEVKKVMRGGIKATLVEIKADEAERSEEEMLEILDFSSKKLGLSESVKRFSYKALNAILEGEERIHGKNHHLHELSSLDTHLEILASGLLLENLNLLNVEAFALPIALGGGHIKISHGLLSIPPPLTSELLRISKLNAFGGPVKEELTTPTGLALLYALGARSVDCLPQTTVEKVGYGAGVKELEVPNIMRVFVGKKVIEDSIVLIETDVDDLSGEEMGYLIERMFEKGALDVSFIPKFGKKSRPGYRISVISKIKDYENLVRVLMSESGSLGVRILQVKRHIAAREVKKIKVDLPFWKGYVSVKISTLPSGERLLKPEYEDVARIAKESGLPLREVKKALNTYLDKALGGELEGNRG